MERARARRATATCCFESDRATRRPVPGLRTTLLAVSVTSAQRHSSTPARRCTSTPASVMRQGYQHVGRADTADCWEVASPTCEVGSPPPPREAQQHGLGLGGATKKKSARAAWRGEGSGWGKGAGCWFVFASVRAVDAGQVRKNGFVRFALVCRRFWALCQAGARDCYGLRPP